MNKLKNSWGQALCFVVAAVALFTSGDAWDQTPYFVVAGLMLATGLALRALAIWREKAK